MCEIALSKGHEESDSLYSRNIFGERLNLLAVSYTHLDVYKRQLFSSLFNIVFDYILMFPLGLGMEGAALATAISPIIGIDVYKRQVCILLRHLKINACIYIACKTGIDCIYIKPV